MAIKQNMGTTVAERDFPIATVNENALVNAPSGEIDIKSRILTVRGEPVMLDRDLAELYGVELKALNQAVKRNAMRFPERFMHQLSREEFDDLKSQIVTSSSDSLLLRLKSQGGSSRLSARNIR